MRILCFLKAILDPEAPPGAIRFPGKVESGDVATVLGPFEGNALELSVQLAETSGGSFVAVAMGDGSQDVALRKALALGAERAARIDAEPGFQDPLAAARRLQAAARELGEADAYVFGRQAGDWDMGFTAGIFAGLMDLPFVPLAQHAEIAGEGLRLRREIAGGYEESLVRGPLVMSVTNGPATLMRLPKVKDVMLANRRPIDVLRPADAAASVTLHEIAAAQVTRQGRMLAGDAAAQAAQLASELRRFLVGAGGGN